MLVISNCQTMAYAGPCTSTTGTTPLNHFTAQYHVNGIVNPARIITWKECLMEENILFAPAANILLARNVSALGRSENLVCTITKHGDKRLRERVGVSRSAVEKVTEKALKYGIKHSEVSGSLKRYLDKLWLTYRMGHFRIYQQKIYVFTGERLITVLNLPQRFHGTVKKIQDMKGEVTC